MTDIKTDIALAPDFEGVYDIGIGPDGDLIPVYGFETSIIMSVLTESRADSSEIASELRRGGWSGNESGDVEGFEVGSKLWLSYQARQTIEEKNKIIDNVRDALSWYVPRYAALINVDATLTTSGIQLEVEIVRLTGKIEKVFFRLWEITGVQ